MLVLVAGATGNLGQKLVTSLLKHGHQVRGLGRSPSKLDAHLASQLESFVESTAYHDIPALDKACAGADAVICAYLGFPELHLEGQLLLFRAAERANVKRFVAASWCYDWRRMSLGQQDSYDPDISFRHHVEISSSLKPIWIFTGVLAEVLFSAPGRVDFTPRSNGAWDSKGRVAEVWGNPATKFAWTSEADAAEFTAAIVSLPETSPLYGEQFFKLTSGIDGFADIARVYGEVRGCEITIKQMGSVEDLRKKAYEARDKGDRARWWEYIMFFYTLHMLDGTWAMGELDNERVGVKGTSLREFLEAHPDL
ncbi:NAD(P)-binding protein [Cucurbitaria berberidis CBS 394.84]|uniref:NAD(P)-binding protein n=1 Tax=Cucurbitaria berberidis CBS 394.84 TaxID=1168544 RepID=A0A9P4GSZ8_9PLEO|nr:NAD(P)-binding protein [Cucurbitaria berberidis CBS 394.84]KAF1850767.1 NAD(P)-binding protein [Cucurbitaria berberidis CBS 394.84]